jgi:polysaccharide export outer membrane protein
MRISRIVVVLGALVLTAGGVQAQRSPSSSLGLGANPPPVAAPAPRSAATEAPPEEAPAAAPANAPQSSAYSAPMASGGDTSTDKTYVLGPADVIEVSVLGRSEYTTRARISEDGTIQLQYLGVVHAANKTAAQLSDEVAAALQKGGFFESPVVRVDIVSYASRYVTVLGNFVTPGLVPVDRPYHLSEIIARVGGVKDTGANYVILRPQHGEERRITIATLATGAASDDPLVSPGDKIYSPPAELFYVTGQVKGPGAFPIISDMTVRMALSRAGGLTDSGSDKKVTITRKGNKIGHVDLDSRIQPGDVILVGERLF